MDDHFNGRHPKQMMLVVHLEDSAGKPGPKPRSH